MSEREKSSAMTRRDDDTPVVNSADEKSRDKLSPDEQMALFEKELKESDWGHQPC